MSSASPVDRELVAPLLEVLLKEARCDGAYLYAMRDERAELVAWAGQPPGAADLRAALSARDHEWLRTLETALVTQAAARDWRLCPFSEFSNCRFESAVSIALRDGETLAGILNLGRFRAGPFLVEQLDSAVRLSGPLTAVLTRSQARAESEGLAAAVEEMRQKLADRKLIDRAKGVLQQSLGCTEEAAYYTLRGTSRRLRQPMRAVAEVVIQQGRLPQSAEGAGIAPEVERPNVRR
jgi:hypothetical protein